MIHDPDLLDRLEALPKEAFEGQVFRGARQSLDPLASSYSGGRWMRRDGPGVLYTSMAPEGALAEISFHWGKLTPRPTKPVMLHTLRVVALRTLKLIRADLSILGVPENVYAGVNMPRTQEIGAAVEFLGCDGLIAPCARSTRSFLRCRFHGRERYSNMPDACIDITSTRMRFESSTSWTPDTPR